MKSLTAVAPQQPPQQLEIKQRGARPPIPGSEQGSKIFLEAAPILPQMGQSEVEIFKGEKEALKMAPSPKPSEAARERGFEPEGSADTTPPFSESNSNNSSTPPYVRWAENLSNLLTDSDGVQLYKKYLEAENVSELLDFWFACEGLKKKPSDDKVMIYRLVKLINKKFVRGKAVPISEETRKVIQEKIGAKEDVQQDIFDAAQREVEERMTHTTYRNFLMSTFYLNYVQKMQIGESDFSAKCSGSHSTSSSVSGKGPVQDDSGHFSVPIEVEKAKNPLRIPLSSVPVQHADTTSDSTSGISESSGNVHNQAPVHNVTANNNTSVDDEYTQLIQSMSALPTLHEHSELDLSENKPHSASLLGLTSQSLMITQRRRHIVKPEAQAGVYLQSGRAPNPYHAYNSAYNPVSRQDSELQSLSSDAHTTDDNLSSFTESSSHYSYRQITSKKHTRRQLRKAHEQSRQNRENALSSHSQQAFINRTARVPTEASNQLPPTEFAALLIQKLEKVKKDQELHEKLNRKLAEDTGSLVSQDSSRSLAEMIREKFVPADESDQSILDDHVSRIWTDKTPLRSPGDPSGRPRSPGSGFRMKPPIATPMGPIPHRTLPGRGHRGQTRRLPVQQMYHQDLAYYEVDRVTGRQEPRPPTRPMVDPSMNRMDGNTNRVMEWMQEVERQSSGQPDQKSLSSRGANKTSPRSNRPKAGHRSQSQERGMSTSWAGHIPNQFPYQQQPTPMQLEEAKRRLMLVGQHSGMGHNPAAMSGQPLQHLNVSQPLSHHNLSQQSMSHHNTSQQQMGHLNMSHSNNSTLRKGQKPTGGEFTVAVYTFSHEKEPMPYRIRIPTKSVTLKAVKDLLPKKGAFRFYFKTEIDGEPCFEEETEDSNLVPLWKGNVQVQCRLMD